MAYGLEEFSDDARAALKADAGPKGQQKVVAAVSRLLANKTFLAATFPEGEPLGVRTIYKDDALGFCVLAHNYGNRPQGDPHDHGSTWAIYGQADRYTDMIEYRRLDDGGAPGEASVEPVKDYRVAAGEAHLYPAGTIHSVAWPQGARLIRVTGADLSEMPRKRYDRKAGRVSEGVKS